MNFLLDTILQYLLLYKYAALFSVTLLAAIALPIPSAATLMASAAFASQGYMHIGLVFLTAAFGNILGDNIGYWTARIFGKPVLERIGLRRIVNSHKFKVLEKKVDSRPGYLIFFSRFEVIATLSVNFISGLGKMPYRKYLFFEVIGEMFQVSMYATIGYVFGNSWQEINSLISRFSILLAAVAALVLALFWKKFTRWLSRFLS